MLWKDKMQKQKIKQAITKDKSILEIVAEYPEVVPILMGYGLHCVGCHFSQFDTLENGARIHGMSKEDFNMMLKDVNALVSELKKK